MRIFFSLVWLAPLLAQQPDPVYLRSGGPDGFELQSCTNTTPVACTTKAEHGLQPGDVVIISNVYGTTIANGPRKVKETPTVRSFSLTDLSGKDLAGNGDWKSGALPGASAGPVYGGKAIPYQLKPHPRVWLDGPTGEMTRRIAMTSATGLLDLRVQGGVATVTTAVPHRLSDGNSIGVWNATNGLNGTYAITVVSPTQYTFSTSAPGGNYLSATVLISSVAHRNNPSWNTIVQNTSGTCIAPPIDAIRWYIDRSQKASLKCAKDTLLNVEGKTGGYWGYGGAFPLNEAKPYGGNVDTDYASANMLEIALMYEFIRSELTADERKLFRDKILNDLGDGCTKTLFRGLVIARGKFGETDSAKPVLPTLASAAADYGGLVLSISGGTGAGQTRKIVTFDATSGAAVLDRALSPKPSAESTFEILGTAVSTGTTVTIRGARFQSSPDPELRLEPGDRLSNTTTEVGLAPQVVTVLNDTQVIVDRTMTWKDTLVYTWKPWKPGTCGLLWFTKHHPSSPASHPVLYPQNGGTSSYGISPQSNTGLAKVTGDLALMLSLADEDPRAARRLQEVWSYYYDNNLKFTLSLWTGFNQSGSYYGLGRVMWMPAMISWMMNGSVENFPDLNLKDVYAAEPLRLLMYSWLPNSTSGSGNAPFHVWWGAENGNTAITPDSGLQRPLYSPSAWANSGTEVGGYYLNWLRQRYQYKDALRRHWAQKSFFFIDPNFPDQDYRQQPTQRLFRDTSSTTCANLGLTCKPGLQLGGFISRTDWERDKGTHVSGYTNDWIYAGNPDHATAEAGNYRIWKGRPLVGVDGNSSTWPEALVSGGEDLTKRANLIELGGKSNLDRVTGNVSFARWAGPYPSGDPASRYAYLMMDLTQYYLPASGASRVHRHLAHFKAPGMTELVVIYDDIATSSATSHRSQVHYQQNGKNDRGLGVEGSTRCPGAENCATLNATRLVSSVTAPAYDTGIVTRFLEPAPGSLRVYVDNPDGTYTLGRGNTFRVSYCGSTDGTTCSDKVRATEAIVVHKLQESASAEPKLEATLLSPAEDWTGMQAEGAVALFARRGNLQTSLSFSNPKAGERTQYLIAGLAAGTYQVMADGVSTEGGPVVVPANDNSLYFVTSATSIQIYQKTAAAALFLNPEVVSQTVNQGDAPAEVYLKATSDGASINYKASVDVPWMTVTPEQGSTATEADLKVILNGAGLDIGTYGGFVSVDSPEAANGRQRTKVYLTVAGASSDLTLNPASLALTGQQGEIVSAQVQVTAVDGSSVTPSIQSGSEWLALTADQTNTPFTLTVSVDTSAIEPGTYISNITFTLPNSALPPKVLIVQLTVT